MLLGHDCPLESYPSIVLPVGRSADGAMVVIYHANGQSKEDPIPDESEFVHYDDDLLKKLETFMPEYHRLFAYDESNIDIIPIEHEREFFQLFLTNTEHLDVDPFLRLSFARVTRMPNLVFREIGRCVVALHESPTFLQSWCDKEVTEMIDSLGRGPKVDFEPDPSKNSRKVVIFEDNEAWAFNLREHFELKGYTVWTASDGVHGLALALDVCPDLIIIDLRMPIMDGYEVLQRIKALPDLAIVPIIILSAHLDEWAERRSELTDIRVFEGLAYLDDFEDFAAGLAIEDKSQRNIFLSKQVEMEIIEKHADFLVG